jgi:hypothetical protein
VIARPRKHRAAGAKMGERGCSGLTQWISTTTIVRAIYLREYIIYFFLFSSCSSADFYLTVVVGALSRAR